MGVFSIFWPCEALTKLLPAAGSAATLVRRPAEHQYLTPWPKTDRQRLGLIADDVIPIEPEIPVQADELGLGLKDVTR